jgi:hypothetical protein
VTIHYRTQDGREDVVSDVSAVEWLGTHTYDLHVIGRGKVRLTHVTLFHVFEECLCHRTLFRPPQHRTP